MTLPSLAFTLATTLLALGATCQQWSQLQELSGRAFTGAFDPNRQRPVVMTQELGMAADLWEWSGTRWLRRDGEAQLQLFNPVLVTDTLRNRVLGFGINYSAGSPARAYDGVRWQQIAGASTAPASGSAIAFDAARDRVLAFGGLGVTTTATDRLVAWNGAAWLVVPVSGNWPPPRIHAMLAYDPLRSRTVLHGGLDAAFATLSDTWEWDGASWTQVNGPGPGPRWGAGMAFDPLTAAIVLFGGADVSSFNDTWRFNGSWTQVPTAVAPDARGAPLLIATSAVLLLVGGSNGVDMADTWLFTGTTWVRLQPGHNPPGRTRAAMEYDSARGETVLFGGLSSLFSAFVRHDCWTWNGTWQQRQPTTMPPWRMDADMACDRARGEVVMFGGSTGTPLNDTWVWNGQDWSLRTGTVQPPARSLHRLAYDSARQRVVLFGGFDNASVLGDTWLWDGLVWSQHGTASAPPARSGHHMAFDAARGQTVMFGGSDAIGSLVDTWLFGSSWSAAAPTVVPNAAHNCEYDQVRQRVVAIGIDREWSWTGSNWVMATAAMRPYSSGSVSCFDERRQRVLVFGGEMVDGVDWLLAYTPTPPSQQVYGAGCAPVAAPVPDLFAVNRPRIGEAGFELGLRTDASGRPMLLALGWLPLQAPLGGGCNLLVDQIAFTGFLVSGAGGFASSPLPVPRQNVLRGLDVRGQAFALLPGGLAASAGLRITVGD